jgi:hypothetical protein
LFPIAHISAAAGTGTRAFGGSGGGPGGPPGLLLSPPPPPPPPPPYECLNILSKVLISWALVVVDAGGLVGGGIV